MSLAGQVKQFSTPAMNKEAGKWDRRMVSSILKLFPQALDNNQNFGTVVQNLSQGYRNSGPAWGCLRLPDAYDMAKELKSGNTEAYEAARKAFLTSNYTRPIMGAAPTKIQDAFFSRDHSTRKIQAMASAARDAALPPNNLGTYGERSSALNFLYEIPVTKNVPAQLPTPLPREVSVMSKPPSQITGIFPRNTTKTLQFPFLPDSAEYPTLASVVNKRRLFKGLDPDKLSDMASYTTANPFVFSSGYPDIAAGYAKGGGVVSIIPRRYVNYDQVYTPHMMSVDETLRKTVSDTLHQNGNAWDDRALYETITPLQNLSPGLVKSKLYIPDINNSTKTVTLHPAKLETRTIPAEYQAYPSRYSDQVIDYALTKNNSPLCSNPSFASS